jgi:hypothetical protein
VIEATEGIEGPLLRFEFRNHEGVRVFASPAYDIGGTDGRLAPGERRRAGVAVENRLAAGRYQVNWALYRNRSEAETVEWTTVPVVVTVRGMHPFYGIVELDHEWSLDSEPASLVKK